jgi:hypothetical protein
MSKSETAPFDPATMCHPKPEFGGADGCPYIKPCALRCHIRWLDGHAQPNDSLVDAPGQAVPQEVPNAD